MSMMQFRDDVLTDAQVAAYAADHRAALRYGPEKQAEIELQIRRYHAEDTARRELSKVETEDYLRAVNGSPMRLAEMYIATETLLRSNSLPDRVWDALNEISGGWLGTLHSIPCDSEEAIKAKEAALVFYIDADEDLEIDTTFAEFAREIREARSRPTANDNPPAPAAGGIAVDEEAA